MVLVSLKQLDMFYSTAIFIRKLIQRLFSFCLKDILVTLMPRFLHCFLQVLTHRLQLSVWDFSQLLAKFTRRFYILNENFNNFSSLNISVLLYIQNGLFLLTLYELYLCDLRWSLTMPINCIEHSFCEGGINKAKPAQFSARVMFPRILETSMAASNNPKIFNLSSIKYKAQSFVSLSQYFGYWVNTKGKTQYLNKHNSKIPKTSHDIILIQLNFKIVLHVLKLNLSFVDQPLVKLV